MSVNGTRSPITGGPTLGGMGGARYHDNPPPPPPPPAPIPVRMLPDDFFASFSKINLSDGDVLIVNIESPLNMANTNNISEIAKKHFPDNEVILCTNGVHIESFPEKEMNNLGWYRKPSEGS